jgi:tetratricopeptide (TPR) repeat protein
VRRRADRHKPGGSRKQVPSSQVALSGPRRATASASPPTRPATDRRTASWAVAIAFALGFLAYANTLGHGFVWDDLILLDQKIRFYRGPLDVFLEPQALPTFKVYRPLTFGSYYLDQILWSRNPFGFHLTSVLLHAVNSALVYVLAAALGCASGPALWAALLFAVHPIHTEAVAWIACRADLLTTTFAILTILALLRYRASSSWASLAAVAVSSFAAIASKETGAAVPLVMLAVPGPRFTKPEESNRPDRGVWLGFLASTCGLLAYWVLRPADRSPDLGPSAFTPSALGSLIGAFGFYIARTFVPLGLTAYMPEAPGGLAMSLLAAVGVALAVALLFARSAAQSMRRFGTLWFLLALAPPLLVAVSDMLVTKVSERYLYLPSVGLCLLVASALSPRPRLLSKRGPAVAMAAGLAALTLVTVARNRVWRDEITLWSAVVSHETRFAIPYMNLGLALADAGRFDEAERAYRAALAARADDTAIRDTYVNLGHLKLRQGSLGEAADLFARANAIAPHASAYYGLGVVARTRARERLAAGDRDAAAQEFARARAALEAALAINPRHHQSQYVLASVLYQTGDMTGAVEHYRRVVDLVGDTATGRDAAEALGQLTAWLSDPAHRQR